MEQAQRNGTNWTAAIVVKEEGNPLPETLEELRARPCTRDDVRSVWEWVKKKNKRNVSLEEKVRLGFLMHCTGGEEAARQFGEARDLRVTSVDLKRWKLMLHINFFMLNNKKRQRPFRHHGSANEIDGSANEIDGTANEMDGSANEMDGNTNEQVVGTQLEVCQGGDSMILTASGSNTQMTQGPLRIVERSATRGTRVFRPRR